MSNMTYKLKIKDTKMSFFQSSKTIQKHLTETFSK